MLLLSHYRLRYAESRECSACGRRWLLYGKNALCCKEFAVSFGLLWVFDCDGLGLKEEKVGRTGLYVCGFTFPMLGVWSEF